jgi:glycerate kinase
MDLTGVRPAIMAADVVITGEGSWDAQIAAGKGPQAVLEAARGRGKPVIAMS